MMASWARAVGLLLLISTCLSGAVLFDDSQYFVSCYNAKNTNFSTNALCSFVTWGSANLYQKDIYSPYNYGAPLSSDDQSLLAMDSFLSLRSVAKTTSEDCDKALAWFACADAFPYCPVAGVSSSAISYLPVCKFHCHQAKSLCDIPGLDCDAFPGGNCMTYLPDDYFLIPPDQGPLDTLPSLYLAVIVIWAVALIAWGVACLVYYKVKARPPPVLAMGAIYATCLMSSCVAYFFWIECSAYLGMCTFEATYATMAGLQALEAVKYMGVVYIARHLSIVTSQSLGEVGAAWFLDIIFFAISFALRSVILRAPSTYWIIMISLLYFFVFYTILSVSSHEWRRMKGQMLRMTSSMPAHVVKQVEFKTWLSGWFFFAATSLLTVEIICQCLFALNVPVQALLIFYEACQVVLFISLGVIFRPRKWSPFFFMEPSMSPAVADDSNRQPTVVRVDGVLQSSNPSAEVPSELELAPLLNGRARRGEKGNFSILIQPDGELLLGQPAI